MKGVMIGGFALAAAPAEYRVTGVKTFIVSHDGVVYEKDLGQKTPETFKKMELLQSGQDLDARRRHGGACGRLGEGGVRPASVEHGTRALESHS